MANKLTDLPGVGPSTAERLRRAGYTNPDDLRTVAPAQLSQIEGIGRSTAERIVSEVAFSEAGPFDTTYVSGGTRSQGQIGEAKLETERGDALELNTRHRGDPNQPTRAFEYYQVDVNPARGGRYEHREAVVRTEDPDAALAAMNAFGSAFAKAQAAHNERPAAERRTDEALRAETTRDFEEWNQNKGRFDFPGVDTP